MGAAGSARDNRDRDATPSPPLCPPNKTTDPEQTPEIPSDTPTETATDQTAPARRPCVLKSRRETKARTPATPQHTPPHGLHDAPGTLSIAALPEPTSRTRKGFMKETSTLARARTDTTKNRTSGPTMSGPQVDRRRSSLGTNTKGTYAPDQNSWHNYQP